MVGKNPPSSPCSPIPWTPSSAISTIGGERLAKGLFNTLSDAKAEEDLPRRDALLEELRALAARYPDDAAARERLAKGLFNTLNHVNAEEDMPRRDKLLGELKQLIVRFPHEPVFQEIARLLPL